jgi:hypothetical protein
MKESRSVALKDREGCQCQHKKETICLLPRDSFTESSEQNNFCRKDLSFFAEKLE